MEQCKKLQQVFVPPPPGWRSMGGVEGAVVVVRSGVDAESVGSSGAGVGDDSTANVVADTPTAMAATG